MDPVASAEMFLYTDASFGHSGSTGFQFIGLPRDASARVHADEIENFVRIKLPTGMHPDESGFEKAPVALRIIGAAFDSRPLMVRVVSVGQVYRSGGTRGKYGNVLAQAFLLPTDIDLKHLLLYAISAPWISELDGKTLSDEVAVDYSPIPLSLPHDDLDIDPSLPDADLLLAAILARKDGGMPILLPELGHVNALALYAEVSQYLPETFLRKLSWSTYEFDGRSGFDVVATQGNTSLSNSSAGFQILSEIGADDAYAFAARCIINGNDEFWARLDLHGNILNATEPGLIKSTALILKSLDEAGVGQISVAEKVLHRLAAQPATRGRVAEAGRIFIQAFSYLSTVPKLADLVRAFRIVQELETWSAAGLFRRSFERWAEGCSEVHRVFDANSRSDELLKALEANVSEGKDAEDLLRLCFLAADAPLREGNDPLFFAQAVYAMLKAQTKSSSSKLLTIIQIQPLLERPERFGVFSEIVRAELQRTPPTWYDHLRFEIASLGSSFDQIKLADLDAHILLHIKAKDPKQGLFIANQMISLGPQHWATLGRTGDVEKLLVALDAATSNLDFSNQHKLASKMAEVMRLFGIGECAYINTYALLVARGLAECPALNHFEGQHKAVLDRVPKAIYTQYAFKMWSLQQLSSILLAEEVFSAIWRDDIGEALVIRAADDLGKACLLNKKSVQRLLFSEAVNAAGKRNTSMAWQKVLRDIAFRIGLAMSDADFDAVMDEGRYSSGHLVGQIEAQRKAKVKARLASVGRGVIRYVCGSSVLGSLTFWRKDKD